MDGGFLLDVVVGKGVTTLKLLPSKDQTLLVRGNTLLALDPGLYGINAIRRLDLEGHSLPSESLDKDLHVVNVKSSEENK